MKSLLSLNKYFWKYKYLFFLGTLFVILSNYFRILAPQVTGFVVNTVVESMKQKQSNVTPSTNHNNQILQWVMSHFSKSDFQQKIFLAGIVLLALAIISGFFMFLMRQTIIVMSRHIEFHQKNEIFQHYQKLDISFYKSHATGDMMNRISEDVSRVRMFTGPAIMYFINLAAVIGFSVFFMLLSDVKLTLVALCPLPILAVVIYFVNTIIQKKSEKIQSELSNLTTNAQESYTGIRVIKSFVQEQAMLGFFKKNSTKYMNSALSLAKTEAIYFPSMGLIIGLSTIITIMVASLDVVNGVPGASVGRIAEFVLYIQMLTFPVSAIGWTASMTQRAATSQTRINEFLHTSAAIQEKENAEKPVITGNIIFENVNFTYANTGIQAIQQMNFNVDAGQKIAILGKTGSGKSTIAQLLLRMYDVDSGNLFMEGVPISDIQLEHLRTTISYVPQEVFLFSDTIENNIRFGKHNATRAEVEFAAKQASIFDEIMSFSDGFDTMVGERGVTLSGGQKQRISIARALLKEKPIIIFDDCLSAVDTKTEEKILRNMAHHLQNKTAFFITHRIISQMQFDQIIVLENGKKVETGTHEQLMSKQGLYFEMHQMQVPKQNIDSQQEN
jgi:ATP-binding cassette subfamily B protein